MTIIPKYSYYIQIGSGYLIALMNPKQCQPILLPFLNNLSSVNTNVCTR